MTTQLIAQGSGRQHVIVNNVTFILQQHVREQRLGVVFPAGLGYMMNDPQGQMLVPDGSFIRTPNLRADWNLDEPYPGIPDLAIEVVVESSDEGMRRKLQKYMDNGVSQVWILRLRARSVYQYTHARIGNMTSYGAGDVIDTSALFPELYLAVNDIFEMPAWVL
ncbi:MAG: Uma2 family endonuclease [Chloroflexota bacterium]